MIRNVLFEKPSILNVSILQHLSPPVVFPVEGLYVPGALRGKGEGEL